MDDPFEAQRDQFYIARSEALNAYNLLEQGMAIIFANLLSQHKSFGTLIISKMINTRARNEVVQKIIDYMTAKRFRLFTNSLFVLIGEVDGKRNSLVHWHLESKEDEFWLRPTDLLGRSPERLTEHDIDQLTHKCLFLTRALSRLRDHVKIDERDYPTFALGPAWHERFQRPLAYPPEPDDPLFRYYIADPSPPAA